MNAIDELVYATASADMYSAAVVAVAATAAAPLCYAVHLSLLLSSSYS